MLTVNRADMGIGVENQLAPIAMSLPLGKLAPHDREVVKWIEHQSEGKFKDNAQASIRLASLDTDTTLVQLDNAAADC